MDRSQVKAIVERELEPLMERLGIPHWNITASYSPLSPDDGRRVHAEITRNSNYNSAHIDFNPEPTEDEAHLLKVLRHELFHVLLSPYDLYGRAVEALLEDDPVKQKVFDEVLTNSMEQAVINLERMYAGLTRPKASEPCDASSTASPTGSA